MSKNILVRNYLEALFKESESDFENIQEEISAILELCLLDKDLYLALASNILRESIKMKILHTLFACNQFSHQTQNFLLLLVKNKRFVLFTDIARQFLKLSKSGLGTISAIVTSSSELGELQKSDVVHMLESKFGKKFEITTKVDPEILGGLVIEYGSMLLDLSLKGQIDLIQEQSGFKLQALRSAL